MKKLLVLLALSVSVMASAQTQHLTVGSKKFTEGFVLGEIATGLLRQAGFDVEHKKGMGATIILWQALKGGSIDVYGEYTGTISEEILKAGHPMTDEEMRAELAKVGIGMTDQLGFNNTYTLVMKEDRAKALGIIKISDLRNHPELKAGPSIEFLGRKDGWKPLMAKYGVNLADVKGIEHVLGYKALDSGDIDVMDAYSTDAAIAENHLVSLQDDLGFFPQYKAVYLYKLSLPKAAVDALNSTAGTIHEPDMINLNAAAEKTKDIPAAAKIYLDAHSTRTNPGEAIAKPEQNNVNPWAEILAQAGVHLKLVGISLAFAILIGVPLGIWASKPGPLSSFILGATGLMQTIPSLALFAILVPWLGIGATTAILALFLYSLLPIVRNTATGLSGIPPSQRESAEALGLEPMARLTKIDIPLALPTILAGIKVSAIINVGTATIAAFIGAGGLGESIQTGLALSDAQLILRGGIAAAVLALLVQFAFDLLDKAIISPGLRQQTKTA